MTKSYNVRDAKFIATDTMPGGAGTTKAGTALDLGNTLTANGARMDKSELLLTMPALTDTMVPSTKTMTFSIETCDDSAFGAPTVLWSLVTTGGGAGVAAATYRVKVPTNCLRYVRAKAVSGSLTTDSSAVSMKLELLF